MTRRRAFSELTRPERIELTMAYVNGHIVYVVEPLAERTFDMFQMTLGRKVRPIGSREPFQTWNNPEIPWQVWVPLDDFEEHAKNAPDDIRDTLLQAIPKLQAVLA